MNRKKVLIIGIVACGIIAVACLWGLYGKHNVTLDAAAIQKQIDKQLDKEFPITGKAKVLLKGATVTAATVHIKDGRINSDITVQGRLIAGKKFVMDTAASGVPEFSSGAFYFKPEKIDFKDLAYEGTTPSGLMAKFADRYVSDKKASLLINDAAPKVEEWLTTVAENAVMHSLQRRPIYRPGDDVKGLLIKASLQSISVQDDKIHITFTLWKLTVTVLTGIFFLIAGISMLIALMRSPTIRTVVEVAGCLG